MMSYLISRCCRIFWVISKFNTGWLMYSLLEMLGLRDLLHRISLKFLSMLMIFLLYSPTLLPAV